jgi:hypothetical protein
MECDGRMISIWDHYHYVNLDGTQGIGGIIVLSRPPAESRDGSQGLHKGDDMF